MKRIIAVFLLSLFLFGCSSHSDTWTWISHDGTVFEFPATWETSPFNSSSGVSANDGYVEVYFFPDSNHDFWEKKLYEEPGEVIEIETDTGNRVIRTEFATVLLTAVDGEQTEFVQYVAFVPDDGIAYANVPDTPELARRESAIIDVLQSVYVPQYDQNVLSFYGGLAVLTYSDDWKITNWNSSEDPVLQNDNLNLVMWTYPERIDVPEREDITAQDTIDFLLERMMDDDVETFQRRRTTIHRDSNRFLFALDNGLVFFMGFHRLDDTELQVEDEAVILQMIDSILLNNRNSYYEPINLVLP